MSNNWSGKNNPKYSHGLRYHTLYGVWLNIKSRCLNPKNKKYHNYGGRGITICNEWINNPKAFIEWSLDNGWNRDLEIDRINNKMGYSPENCRFIIHRDNILNGELLQKSNTSGYRGVNWHKRDEAWVSRIAVKGKRLNLGYFDSPGLAALRFDVEVYIINDERPMNFIDSCREASNAEP